MTAESEEFLISMQECQRTPKTITGYRCSLNQSLKILSDAGLQTTPELIDRHCISILMAKYAPLAASTRHWHIAILNQFLLAHGNRIVPSMRIVWPQDWRSHADWLDPADAVILMESSVTPAERLCISLELGLGLRRVEVIRLRLRDIQIDKHSINVRGKGRADGKWRTLYLPDSVAESIRAWLPVRSEMIRAAHRVNPDIPIPEELLIYKKYKAKPQLGSYSEKGTGYDKKIIAPVVARSGIRFSNHTLRRTFRPVMLAGRCQGGDDCVPAWA